MLKKIAPYILFVFYRLLQFTWRIRIIESDLVKTCRENGEPFIVAHWHGHELGILHLLKPYHVSCIISTSKDGDLMNKAVQLLGAETVRGSSTRGGSAALKGIIKMVRTGRRPSVAVDGPKGPIYKVKPGVFQISRMTGLPIVPISFHASRSYIFEKSWNKSELPLPFAKVTIMWGENMPAITRDQDPKGPVFQDQLEQKLNQTRRLCQLKSQ